MLTITEAIPEFHTYEKFLGYDSRSCLFFDIETTGLSPASAAVFLIGAVRRADGTDGGWELTQWLAQDPADEPAVLQAFFDAAGSCSTLVHFNGSSFDLPFLKERAGHYQLAQDLSEKVSLDLYQIFRPLRKPLGLERMNQTSLEQFLGWPRRDRLTGKHMVSMFFRYAASGEPGLRDLLLLHNHDDLLGMTDLLRLSAYLMLFGGETGPVSASAVRTGPAGMPDAQALTLLISLKAALPQSLSLSAPFRRRAAGNRAADQSMPDAACENASGGAIPGSTRQAQDSGIPHTPDGGIPHTPELYLHAAGEQAVITVPGIRGELLHFFPDYKNYYYLPLEDQAIHKSVAAFVDREYRTPARPSNCYIKKSGLFFPQTEEYFSPAFKLSFESKELYFCCTETGVLPEHAPEKLTAYAASLLRIFLK